MDQLSRLLHDSLPLLAVILLIVGLTKQRINYLISALWLSLIALLLHYQTAGGELLGTYFNYTNSAIYTLNLVVLITTILCLFYKLPLFQGKRIRYATGLFSVCLIIGGLLLLINLWINARFVETRRPGTPIMQVAAFTPLSYCSYRYVFYKVALDGKIGYLCPNYYGVIPSAGTLDLSPAFLLNQLGQQLKAKINTEIKKP